VKKQRVEFSKKLLPVARHSFVHGPATGHKQLDPLWHLWRLFPL